MRTDIRLDVRCACCGETLEADSENTKYEFHGADNVQMVLAIRPCDTCMKAVRRPLHLMREAPRLIGDGAE